MFTVKSLIVFGIASLLLCSTIARAEPLGRTFVGDFIGNDATTENYLSIAGDYDRSENSESLYLEKTISPNSSFSIFIGYQRFEQEEESTSSSNFEMVAHK